MPDLNKQFEAQHRRNILRLNQRILEVYRDAINQVTLIASSIVYNGGVISLDQYPLLAAKMDQVIASMKASVFATIVNSISDSWDLSNQKNNLFVDKRLAGRQPSPAARQILYDPNADALREFINRKEAGLNLSQRVYKALDLYGPELERGLLVGISKGESAAEMTQDLRQYLKYPDKVFRRVRDAKGELRLSKAAEAFHPGQGVYRSSYKNAIRLSGTETNMAYRKSDNVRWSQLPFVVGQDIKLSGAHRICDVCNDLQGAYPKDFIFVGWHPQCICYSTPRMLSNQEYSKYEDEILGIGTFDGQAAAGIAAPPDAFNEYLEKNKDRINGWKNTPYWVRDNPGYTKKLLTESDA